MHVISIAPVRRTALVVLLLSAALLCTAAFAAEPADKKPFTLTDGQTIVVLGDSNTFRDSYVEYLDAYLFTRFPDKRFNVISRGIPSETAAGTSEPSHIPPRPDVHTRFDRTVLPHKPAVVTVCYGMNDGLYRPPTPEIMEKYQAGIERLIARIRDDVHAMPIVLSPPPFDYRPFVNKKSPNGEVDYRFPAPEYDQTLGEFTKWLLTLRSRGLRVVDLHTPLNAHLEQRRQQDDAFMLSPDGIHPSPTGHWLMANAILRALDAPGSVASGEIDAAGLTGSADMSGIEKVAGGWQFRWTTLLPLPLDPDLDPKSVALENSAIDLSDYRLAIKNLPPGKYRLMSGDQPLLTLAAAEWAEGVDLMRVRNFPTHERSAAVLKLVQSRRRILQQAWLKDDPHPRIADLRVQLQKNSTATQEQADDLEKQIRTSCHPQAVALRLEAVAGN